MQLNMQRSAAVTGEVRQLVAEKRLDILLLLEPFAGKLGACGTVLGLGAGGVGVAATRSQYPSLIQNSICYFFLKSTTRTVSVRRC